MKAFWKRLLARWRTEKPSTGAYPIGGDWYEQPPACLEQAEMVRHEIYLASKEVSGGGNGTGTDDWERMLGLITADKMARILAILLVPIGGRFDAEQVEGRAPIMRRCRDDQAWEIVMRFFETCPQSAGIIGTMISPIMPNLAKVLIQGAANAN